MKDAEGRYRFANAALGALTGRDPSELLGRSDLEVFGPDEGGALRAVDRAVLETGLPQVSRGWVTVGGRRRHFINFKYPYPGEGGGVVGQSVEVTDETEARERSARTEAALRRVLDHLPVGVLVVRDDGTIAYGNDPLARMLGHDDPAALLGLPVLDLLHPDDRPQAGARMDRLLAGTDVPERRESRWVRADGAEALFDAVPAGRLELDAGPAGLTVLEDRTARRDLARRLVTTDRLAALGTLAGGAAHELNNPLAVIKATLGFVSTELAELGQGVPPPVRDDLQEALAEALEAVAQARRVIGGLRTFAATGGGARVEPVDLAEVVSGTLALAAPRLRREATLVREDYPAPRALGDRTHLAQVILDLVTNALRAGAASGRPEVTVVTGPGEPGRVRLSVLDRGPGIPEHLRGRVFDPFFSAWDGDAWDGERSTGLGLAAAHGVVTSLGGRIEVADRPGGGTEVIVRLPAAPEDDPE